LLGWQAGDYATKVRIVLISELFLPVEILKFNDKVHGGLERCRMGGTDYTNYVHGVLYGRMRDVCVQPGAFEALSCARRCVINLGMPVQGSGVDVPVPKDSRSEVRQATDEWQV